MRIAECGMRNVWKRVSPNCHPERKACPERSRTGRISYLSPYSQPCSKANREILRQAQDDNSWLSRTLEPVCRKIIPMRIQGRDQRILFLAPPTLELLLPRKRIAHLAVVLVINKMTAVIMLGEAAGLRAGAVLPDSHPQFARDADVKGRACIVADDVDPVVVVRTAHGGERLEVPLSNCHPELCRRISRLALQNQCRMNGKNLSPFFSPFSSARKTKLEVLPVRLRSGQALSLTLRSG